MYFYYIKRNPRILYLGVLTIDSSKKSHTTEQMFYCEKRKSQTIRKSDFCKKPQTIEKSERFGYASN